MEPVERIEANEHLAPLVDRVEHGHEVVITRDGRDVARVMPIRTIDWARRRKVIAELRKFGRNRPLGDLSIESMREEGRR